MKNRLLFAVCTFAFLFIAAVGTSWDARAASIETWQTVWKGEKFSPVDVIYGNGIYVAVGNDGNILYSTNGSEWLTCDKVTSNNLLSIAYGSNTFVIVGSGGTILNSQNERLKVMNKFKIGAFRYLVATDVAARGIDIDNISLVLNYDLPRDGERYVHRIGRTGRINNNGRAVSFITSKDNRLLRDIQHFIEQEIPLKNKPDKEAINNLRQEFSDKMNLTPDIKEAKGAILNKEILKLHINAGKKTKMRAVDIVGTLCNIDGMTAQDIGIINILDISSFVEILNNKGEMVLEELGKRPIKGRLRQVSKVGV